MVQLQLGSQVIYVQWFDWGRPYKQGVYSSHFMSRVEAFATRIKIESSNQSSVWGLIK